MTIYLVRHAHAGSRSQWDGADAERPLSAKGRGQADALRARFADVPVGRVLSSRAVRCQQTVGPLARTHGLDVEVDEALTEGASATATTTLVWELAAAGTDAVLSSHGDVIPSTLWALAGDGVAVDDSHGLPKGTYYELAVTPDGAITQATFVDPRP